MIESGLDYQTLLSVYNNHTSVVNTLWGILQVVSIALLGFVYQQEHLRRNWPALIVLSAAFLVFAFGNQAAMERSQKVLVAVNLQMKSVEMLGTITEESGMKPVLLSHETIEVADMRRYHTVFSAGVVLLIWVTFIMARLKDRGAVDAKADAP